MFSGVALLVLLNAGCSGGPPERAATTNTPPCATPLLTPTYLPRGLRPASREPVIGEAEWVRTWAAGHSFVQVLAGVEANLGADPSTKPVKVRGTFAVYDLISDPGQPARWDLSWREDTQCGPRQFDVIGEGFTPPQLVRIANSLARG